MSEPVCGDARFFRRTGPHPVAAVARAAGGEAAASSLMLTGAAPLDAAGPSDVSYLDSTKFLRALARTRAGAVIVSADHADRVPSGAVAIVTRTPHESWARAVALFHPAREVAPGIHPSAVVAASARVDPSCEVGPLAVIGERAELGPSCRIEPHAVIGEGVTMGAGCRIGACASVSHALLGAGVYVYPGARIGQEGFGFAVTERGFLSVPQIGRVILEDGVEVGANSTVDRGSLADTVIGAGTRLDNLVQVAHNVRIGRACVLVAQVGISGSAVLEDQVMLGGQAGIVGHVRVGRGAKVGAKAGVMSDVTAGTEVVGAPALPGREWFRLFAVLRRLGREHAAEAKASRGDGTGA
jgi:UDP-3-O-[3-hydroxymyristoyl] glucosamine N-acyltransferase